MRPSACLLLGACLLTGCLSPYTTRLPTFNAGHPAIERQLFERHDPFPDRSFGPDTEARPPGFNSQRTEPRRSYEDRWLRGLRPQLEPTAPLPSTGLKYTDAVH